MREIDKDILSYRPEIDYETTIRNLVEVNIRPIDMTLDNPEDNTLITYRTDISMELERYNLATVLDGYKQMQDTKQLMKDIISRGIEVEKKTGRDTSSDEYIADIGTESITDPIFAAEEILKEIDNIENLIGKIYDIDLDTVDIDELIRNEEDRIKDIKQKEEEDISFYKEYKFSDSEREYIDQLIYNRSTGIDRLDDYINRLIEEQREIGSSRIDYPTIRDDVKRAFGISTLISTVNVSGNRISNVSNMTMDDVMNGDTQGGLVYLVDVANRSDVKSMSELNYRKTTHDAQLVRDNMGRYNEPEFRSALYDHFIEVDKLKRRYA